MTDARMGRPPLEDGKETRGLSVRMRPEDRRKIRDLARHERTSVAILTGKLLEEALAARAQNG